MIKMFFFAGVDKWKDHYEACGKDSQSPIDILSGSATQNSFPAFTFHDYDALPSDTDLLNNGHTGSSYY